MTDLDLEAIRARCDAATPGPWHVEGGRAVWTPGDMHIGDQRKAEDANFIAQGRQDVPALVAEVERLRKQRGVAEMLAKRAWQLWAGLPVEHQESEAGQRFIGAFGGFSAYFEEHADA